MPSYNTVILIGNLTMDPEVTYTTKGVAVANCSMAINRTYTTDSGEKREDVTFVPITAWDKLAEIMAKYLKKGSPLFLEGRLALDSWEDKQTGQKRTKLKVVAENIQFLGRKEDNQTEQEDDLP